MFNLDKNPFIPDDAVGGKDFHGRTQELKQIEENTFKRFVSTGNSKWGVIVGESRIGKTSILKRIQDSYKDYFFVRISASTESKGEVPELLQVIYTRIMSKIQNEIFSNKTKSIKLKKIFTKFKVSKFKMYGKFGLSGINLGFKFDFDKGELKEIQQQNFVQIFSGLLDIITTSGYKGLILALDDIGKHSKTEDFANYFKALRDEEFYTKDKKKPYILFMSVLNSEWKRITEYQPSLQANFHNRINLEFFKIEEIKSFYKERFNGAGIKVDDKILKFYAQATRGHPLIMQDFGFELFRIVADDIRTKGKEHKINESQSRHAWKIASMSFGERYLRDKLDNIFSSNYKKIWQAIQNAFNESMITSLEIRKNDLKNFYDKKFNEEIKKSQLSNFLSKMKELDLLKLINRNKGIYRFQDFTSFFYLVALAKFD